MVKFKVDLGELDKAAAMINQKVQDYEKVIKDFTKIVANINNAWQGEDSVEFVNRIKDQIEDTVKIIAFMKRYGDLLRDSSKAYSNAQKDVIAFAKSL